jgi:hypothetical protein
LSRSSPQQFRMDIAHAITITRSAKSSHTLTLFLRVMLAVQSAGKHSLKYQTPTPQVPARSLRAKCCSSRLRTQGEPSPPGRFSNGDSSRINAMLRPRYGRVFTPRYQSFRRIQCRCRTLNVRKTYSAIVDSRFLCC